MGLCLTTKDLNIDGPLFNNKRDLNIDRSLLNNKKDPSISRPDPNLNEMCLLFSEQSGRNSFLQTNPWKMKFSLFRGRHGYTKWVYKMGKRNGYTKWVYELVV